MTEKGKFPLASQNLREDGQLIPRVKDQVIEHRHSFEPQEFEQVMLLGEDQLKQNAMLPGGTVETCVAL